MVKPKGWDGVKPYWWCDNANTRAVEVHLWSRLIHHPENGIFIKGVEKQRPESIELGTLSSHPILNINTNISDISYLLQTVESIRLIMEDSVIKDFIYTLRSEEHVKKQHTYNLQYTWQQLEKKSERLER